MCRRFITPPLQKGVPEDFTDSTFKKEMEPLENKPCRSLDKLMMKKTTADS